MNHILIFEKRFMLYILFLVLFTWSIFVSILAFSNKESIILVGIDGNGTRIITSNNDPIFKTEIVEFLKEFTSNMYNFKPTTYQNRVGQAVEYLSAGLWQTEKNKILSFGETVLANQINLTSEIAKISHIENKSYEILITTKEKSKLLNRSKKIKLILDVENVARSSKNPWGIEIVGLNEHIIN